MVTISVVIPTHNRHALVRRAVRSVLSQRDIDVEVIVVDDRSQPPVPPFEAANVRTVRLSQGHGVGTARNRGIEAATGDWVAFLDDDDIWGPDKARRQLAAVGDADWVFSGAVSVTVSLEIQSTAHAAASLATDVVKRNAIPAGASNVMVRRSLLSETGGFDPRLRHMADWDLWVRLERLGTPAMVDAPDVAYVQHRGNASLDTADVPAELDIMVQRHGSAVDQAYVWRWVAWSHMRASRRLAAAGAYLRAIRAGDYRSVARMPIALLAPGWAIARRSRIDEEYAARADWLEEFR